MTTPSTGSVSTPNMSSLVQAGTQALDQGDLMAALEAFEQVVRHFPDRPEGHNNLGALYNALGENEKAEACFDRVITLLPHNVDLRYNRGVVRSRLEKYDGARDDFEAVLSVRPDDSDTLNNLGVMDFMQGKLPGAAERFRRCLELKPEYTNARLNLIDVEQAMGHGPVAVQLCEDHLRLHNDQEIRRKLLELLSTGCRETLEKASRVAESLVQNENTPENRQEWQRLVQARSALTEASL